VRFRRHAAGHVRIEPEPGVPRHRGTTNYTTFTRQVLARNIQGLSCVLKDDNSLTLGGDTKDIASR
jgi:hypothetical protein